MCDEPPPVSEPRISQGHMIKGSCNIIGRRSWRKAIILPKFGCHRHSCNRDMMIFVWNLILQDHMIRALYDFMIRNLSRYITIIASLVPIDIVVVEIQWFQFVTWSSKTTRSKGDSDFIGRNSSTLAGNISWFLFVTWPCKTTWSKRKITLWLGDSQSMPPFYQLWWS